MAPAALLTGSLQWLQPNWLWLLPVLAIPLLIHLFRRSRPREIVFAAAQWLLPRQQRRWNKFVLRDRLLLLLRLLLVSLLVALLAQPILKRSDNAQDDVLLVDPRIGRVEVDEFLAQHTGFKQALWLQRDPTAITSVRPDPQNIWRVLSHLSSQKRFRRAHVLLANTENPTGNTALKVSPSWQWHLLDNATAPVRPTPPRIVITGDAPEWLEPVAKQWSATLGDDMSLHRVHTLSELDPKQLDPKKWDWVIYDTAGALPAELQSFVRGGGLLITDQRVQWNETVTFMPVKTVPEAEVAPVGRGSWLRYREDWHSAEFFQHSALPKRLWDQWSAQDWQWQFRSRSQWALDNRPQIAVPDNEVQADEATPLDRWLLVLFVLLLLGERAVALSRRDAPQPKAVEGDLRG